MLILGFLFGCSPVGSVEDPRFQSAGFLLDPQYPDVLMLRLTSDRDACALFGVELPDEGTHALLDLIYAPGVPTPGTLNFDGNTSGSLGVGFVMEQGLPFVVNPDSEIHLDDLGGEASGRLDLSVSALSEDGSVAVARTEITGAFVAEACSVP